jgi:hypothetical protein
LRRAQRRGAVGSARPAELGRPPNLASWLLEPSAPGASQVRSWDKVVRRDGPRCYCTRPRWVVEPAAAAHGAPGSVLRAPWPRASDVVFPRRQTRRRWSCLGTTSSWTMSAPLRRWEVILASLNRRLLQPISKRLTIRIPVESVVANAGPANHHRRQLSRHGAGDLHGPVPPAGYLT